MPSPEDQAALERIETIIQNANTHGTLIHKTIRTNTTGRRNILELRRRTAFSPHQSFEIMKAIVEAHLDAWIFSDAEWAGISIQLRAESFPAIN
jgi:hypothetical protein